MNSAIGAVKKAVGYYFKRCFDPGKNGLEKTTDFSMKSKYELVSEDPNINFPHIPFQDGDKEKPVEMCSLEVDPFKNMNGNVEVPIIADTRHIQRRSEGKIVPTLRDDTEKLNYLNREYRP